MKNFQAKKRWRAIMEAPFMLGLFGIVLLFFTWSVVKFVGKMEETAKNRRLAEEKVAELEAEKIKLSNEIQKLGTIEGKEEAIRQKFGLAKPGEGLIVVVDDKNSTDSNGDKSNSGFWSFFTNIFK